MNTRWLSDLCEAFFRLWGLLNPLLFGVLAFGQATHAASVLVTINLGFLGPATLTINPGDTVTWFVQNPSSYEVESYGAEWQSPRLSGSGASYSFTFRTPGDYTYKTRLVTSTTVEYNAAGRIIVQARTNGPPPVMINSPIEGFRFTSPAFIRIYASAIDPALSACGIEFFTNNASLGLATTAPYQVYWQSARQGAYTLTAQAIDRHGARTTSPPVHITIDPSDTSHIRDPVLLPTGQLRLYVNFRQATFWAIESSEDLMAWKFRGSPRPQIPWVDEMAAEKPARFYRLREEIGFAP
jgi:plastocyanin